MFSFAILVGNKPQWNHKLPFYRQMLNEV